MDSYIFVKEDGLIVGGVSVPMGVDVSADCPPDAALIKVPDLPHRKDCLHWYINGEITVGESFTMTPAIDSIIRKERDARLQESDWVMLPDVPQVIKENWIPYRQALRDLPNQAGFPNTVIWPSKPQ